jgi:hypothetical protein
LTALLVIIHQGLAMRGGPHWQMSEPEAKGLTEAAGRVMRHYSIAASQKMIDWGALVTLGFASYGPRIALTVDQVKAQRAANQVPATVYPFTPQPAPVPGA